MYNTKRAFTLYIVIAMAQFSTCPPSVLSLIPTFAQKYAINNHKKPIFAVIIAAIVARVSYLHCKKNPTKEAIRKEIEQELGLANTSFCHAIFNTFFKKQIWKILFKTGNTNLKTVFNINNRTIQKTLLGKIVTALFSNDSTTLEVLIEKPFWGDKFIRPGIKLPLGNGESINEQIQFGYCNDQVNLLQPQSWITPLQYIIKSNHTTTNKLKLINTLLENGANSFDQDQNGNDALHHAVKYAIELNNSNIQVIERLIEAGAKASIPNKKRESCMHLVSTIKNDKTRQQVAKILIRSEPDMDVIDKFGNTPLLNAVKHGRVELVKLFLSETHATIDQTSLKIAFEKRHLDLVEFLLQNEKIPKNIVFSDGETPAHKIAQLDDECTAVKLITILVENESPLNETNFHNKTPLEIAFEKRHLDLVEFLLQNEKIPKNIVFSDGETPAHKIAQLDDECTAVKLITILVENKSPLNETNFHNKTPLEIACAQNNKAVIQQLIEQPEKKIPRNTVYTGGNSMAHLIAKLDDEKAVKLMPVLKDNDFPLDKKNLKGQNILHVAVEHKHDKVACWIRGVCFDLRTTSDNWNQIPLHYLGKGGNQERFRHFYPTDQEKEMTDYRDKTPLQLLEESNTLLSKTLNGLQSRRSRISEREGCVIT